MSESTRSEAHKGEPCATVVRASRRSVWLSPAIALMGVGGIVLAWLMLTDSLEPPRRYRSDASLLFVLVCGFGVLALGFVVLFRTWTSKGTLVAVDGQSIRVQTIKGPVQVDLDQVEYIAATKAHGVQTLAVADVDGHLHKPILRPEGNDWEAVAAMLDTVLQQHRERSPRPRWVD